MPQQSLGGKAAFPRTTWERRQERGMMFSLSDTGWKACATGILAHYRGQVRGIARIRSINDAISRQEMLRGVQNDISSTSGALQELPVC